jgi:hypothetical protein
MQAIADLLEALLGTARSWIAVTGLSLIALAVAWPLLRGRRIRLAAPRPAIAYAIIAVVAFAAAALHTIVAGEPRPPWFQDDFGYLLGADTFFHGRLANPPHPLKQYFETLYVLPTPHRASMYPPGESLLLAGGLALFGAGIVALWFAAAAAACAIAWAVAGAATFETAFLAGLICAIHPTVVAWSQPPRGGALAAIGGALALGGALRLPRVAGIVAMSAGIAVLANTRPYEGLIIATAACAYGLRAWRSLAVAIALAVALLVPTAIYDRAVTGDAFLMPYVAHNARYLSEPNFLWQRPLPDRTYSTLEMTQNYRVFRRYYERSREPREFLRRSAARIGQMFAAALPSARNDSRVASLNGLLLFIALPLFFAVRRGWRFLAAAIVFAFAVLQITWWPQPHYLAPAAALFAILYAIGFERILARGDGAFAFAPIAVAALVAIFVYVVSLDIRYPPFARNRAVAALQPRPGAQLVLADERCSEVVYNGAEIDREKIVFAHDAPGGYAPLLDYYKDREVWRLSCQPFALVHERPALVAARGSFERDFAYPWHFPGLLRESTR